MENSRRKRGISLSHHATPQREERGAVVDQSRVYQIVRPAYITCSTPTQPRFSSAPKQKIIFNYTPQQHSSRNSNPYLHSAQSNPVFSQTSTSMAVSPTYRPLAFIPIDTPNTVQKTITQEEIKPNRHFTNNSQGLKEEAFTQTERINEQSNRQFGSSHLQQSLKNAFFKEQYEKLRDNRRKHLGISKNVVNYKQGSKQQPNGPFSKAELPKPKTSPEKGLMGKSNSKSTMQDLQCLQDMEKRLREIINICDNRLS